MAGTKAVEVAPSNVEQLRAWDGDEGDYWTEHADHFDRALAAYRDRFAAAAGVQVADRVLDIGCGTGETTRDAARTATAGSAVGIDLSSRMIELARRRAADEGLTSVNFEQVDAQIHPFEREAFDVAISRTGAMFFGDVVAAFTNIGRALRPGGRVALLTWQPVTENIWIREFTEALSAGRDLSEPPPDAPGPFSLSDPDRVHALLNAAGFVDVELDAAHEDMWFGTDADDAYAFLRGFFAWLLEGLHGASRARALDALRATVTAHETDEGVVYASAAWIITARRV
jgi:SAM-dependent methyltransferase